jgi:hypothetical protein
MDEFFGTILLSFDIGVFGRMTTVPSGWRKNLNRSPL